MWQPARQALACGSCGTAIDVVAGPPSAGGAFEFLPLLADRPNSGRDWQPGATRVRCAACGTAMDYPAYLAGRSCEACQSPSLVPCDATGAPVHPSAILPFAVTEADARADAAAWLEKRRPTGSRRRFVVETVRAVYVPCWTFSARVRVPWRAERMKKNRKGELEPESIGGVAEVAIDDCLVGASGSIPPDRLEQVEPFPVEDLLPYDPRFLAGYETELYAVNLWDAWDAADARMQRVVDARVRSAAGRMATGLETWPEWSGQRCRHVLVPVYAVDYTYAGTPYSILVNGRTGTIHGRRPIDWIGGAFHVGLALGMVLAIIAGVVWLVVQVLSWIF